MTVMILNYSAHLRVSVQSNLYFVTEINCFMRIVLINITNDVININANDDTTNNGSKSSRKKYNLSEIQKSFRSALSFRFRKLYEALHFFFKKKIVAC